MHERLSSVNEQFLHAVVAAGVFPSREAALEAAVAAFRRHFTGGEESLHGDMPLRDASPADDEHWRRWDRLVGSAS